MDKNMDYNSPLVYQRADPYAYLHTDGYYYFTGTSPQCDNIELRRAKTLNGLICANSRIIWKKHKTGPMSDNIWAPEIFYIDGEWYIYFAAGSAENKWDLHIYALKCSDPNPVLGTWTELGEIDVKAGKVTFSLDMTTFEYMGERYNIWANKPINTTSSNIYIARMKDPITLDSEPMLLSTPEYDWEKLGFDVNEGPAVLIRNGKVFVTYSASDTGWRYRMGMLWANYGDDLLNPDSWHKLNKPVFQFSDKNHQYGPGHNSFTTDGNDDILLYHSRNYKEITGDPLDDINRHAHAKKIEYDENGFPIFGEPVKDNL